MDFSTHLMSLRPLVASRPSIFVGLTSIEYCADSRDTFHQTTELARSNAPVRSPKLLFPEGGLPQPPRHWRLPSVAALPEPMAEDDPTSDRELLGVASAGGPPGVSVQDGLVQPQAMGELVACRVGIHHGHAHRNGLVTAVLSVGLPSGDPLGVSDDQKQS